MKLYVGTYKKYNEGSLDGKWLDLEDYADWDDFLEACYEIHEDEKDPELMFQDCDCDFEWERALYSECGSYEKWYTIKDELDKHGFEDLVLDDYVEVFGNCVLDDKNVITKLEDSYRGKYSSLEDFEESMAEECCDINNVPDYIRNYIDWAAMARDDCDNTIGSNGYVFSNC